MDCIINGVQLQTCNSDNNILFVDSYKEVFFDIFELKIGNNSIIGELVENTKTGPIVRLKQIQIDSNIYEGVSFLVLKEKADIKVHLNESNILTSAKPLPVPKLVYTAPEQLIVEKKISENKPVDVSTQVELNRLKEQALSNIQKEKEKLELLKEQIDTSNKIVENKLEEYKKDLVSQFYTIVEDNKNVFTSLAEKRIENLLENLKDNNKQIITENATELIKAHVADLRVLFEQEKEKTLNQLLDKSEQHISNSLTDINEKVETAFKLFESNFTATAEDRYFKISNYLQDELKKVNDNISTVAADTNEMVETSFKLFESNYNAAAEKKYSEITNNLDSELKKANDNINAIFEEYKEQCLLSIQTNTETNVKIAKEELENKLNAELKNALQVLSENVAESLITGEKYTNLVLEKFLQQHSSKIDAAINGFLTEKTTSVIAEKFDFFKDPKVKQKFEQMVIKEFTIRESELIRKVRKMILDFYYSWGSGGGAGNVTIYQGSSGGGGGGPTEVPYYVFSTSTLTGPSAVIDTFSLASFNTAKYTIQALSGSEVYASEILALGNATVGKYTEYAVIYTTLAPFISYVAVSTGTQLQLIVKAETDLTGIIFKGLRLDPLLQ